MQIVQGFVSQCIETARGDICFQLAVPRGSVKLGKPLMESG